MKTAHGPLTAASTPKTSMPGHTKCCICHAKSSQQTWRSDAPKMQPLSGNQRPDLLTSLTSMSLVLRLPGKMHLCRSSSNVPRLPSFLEMRPNPRFAHFWEGAQSLAPATRNDIWTSKGGPNPLCFSHFDFEMCFAPQRRALFRHLNFQKWSGPGVLCPFWLPNVLRATTACTFWTSQLPKVLRTRQFVTLLTSKCALRHNGVHFFDIATSKSGPKLRCFVHFDLQMCFAPQRRAIFHLSSGQLAPRFSEHTFRPSRATNHWKNTVFRNFLPFARLDLLSSGAFSFLMFFLLLFSSLLFSSHLFSSLLFSSLTLPTSAFPSVHMVRSLTSKLPLVMYISKTEESQHSSYSFLPEDFWPRYSHRMVKLGAIAGLLVH